VQQSLSRSIVSDDGKLGDLERRLAAVRAQVREGYRERARALREAAAAIERGEDRRIDLRRLAHRLRGIAEETELSERAAQLEHDAENADVAVVVAAARALADALEGPAQTESAARAVQSAPEPSKLGWTVLAVDDEPATRRLLQLTLMNLGGCHVRIAADGKSAREALKLGAVDLVLLDAMMPDCDGLELYREFRGALGPEVPIVILSATSAEELDWKLPDDPRLAWRRKPFRPGALVEELREIVERSRKAQ
jgi:CheY-like chemotaxis protein